MATTTTPAKSIAAQPAVIVRPQVHVWRRKVTHYVKRGLFWLLIVFILLYTIFPFYYAIISSLTPSSRLFDTPAVYWPETVTWEHYEYVFRNDQFIRALLNSTIISFSTMFLALTLGSLAAYALGRFRFRGRTTTLYIILSMTMFPAVAILGSLFSMIRGDWLLPTPNLFNTHIALIVTYLTFSLPFTTWVLTNFFKAMPGELEEAALVDGATPMKAFFQVLLPLAAPGLVTTGLLTFIAAWNEFLYALTFTTDLRTVQVAIAQFAGNQQFELPFAKRMAAAVVVTVPLIILVMIFQRKIIAGLTAGAVKG